MYANVQGIFRGHLRRTLFITIYLGVRSRSKVEDKVTVSGHIERYSWGSPPYSAQCFITQTSGCTLKYNWCYNLHWFAAVLPLLKMSWAFLRTGTTGSVQEAYHLRNALLPKSKLETCSMYCSIFMHIPIDSGLEWRESHLKKIHKKNQRNICRLNLLRQRIRQLYAFLSIIAITRWIYITTTYIDLLEFGDFVF